MSRRFHPVAQESQAPPYAWEGIAAGLRMIRRVGYTVPKGTDFLAGPGLHYRAVLQA